MFSATAIGFLVAASAFAWFYAKSMRTTGGNSKKALLGASVLAAIAFVTTIILLLFIDNFLSN